MSRSKWYYEHDGRLGGPISVSELRQLAANGQLQPDDRIRKEEMDRWVKARSVKGLFASTESTSPAEPVVGDTMFDFFGTAPPAPAAEPVAEFHPAFDFFSGESPAKIEHPIPVAPPDQKAKPTRKSDPPASPSPVAPSAVDDSGSFQITVPMGAPTDPHAAFHADIPMAMPASDIQTVPPPPVTAELSGLEIAILPDGTYQPTGNQVDLSVVGNWLRAKIGSSGETYLRMRQLTAVTLRERSGAGVVLSFHAGVEMVAVQCDGQAEAVGAFLRRVLNAAEE